VIACAVAAHTSGGPVCLPARGPAGGGVNGGGVNGGGVNGGGVNGGGVNGNRWYTLGTWPPCSVGLLA